MEDFLTCTMQHSCTCPHLRRYACMHTAMHAHMSVPAQAQLHRLCQSWGSLYLLPHGVPRLGLCHIGRNAVGKHGYSHISSLVAAPLMGCYCNFCGLICVIALPRHSAVALAVPAWCEQPCPHSSAPRADGSPTVTHSSPWQMMQNYRKWFSQTTLLRFLMAAGAVYYSANIDVFWGCEDADVGLISAPDIRISADICRYGVGFRYEVKLLLED
eukprot:366209-Chlamydomonas_euryale.AAC.1